MSGVPYDYVLALVRAHASRNDERFKATVTQIAARMTGRRQHNLMSLVDTVPQTLLLLPHDVRHLVYDAPASDIDLELPSSLVQELEDVISEWSATVELLEVGLRPRTRLLFWGPPGNGKTTCAAQLARKLGLNAYVCSIPGVVDSYMGATGKAVEKVLGLLSSGHAVILDEADALGTDRGGSSAQDKESNRVVSTMLTELDRHRGGLLIATTNRKDMLDAALVRRFDECLEFPQPSGQRLAQFASGLGDSFGLMRTWTEAELAGAQVANYDAATKLVHKEARRMVVAKKAEAAE